MRWDAGALSPHRKLSSTYRYLSNPRVRSKIRKWPRRWLKELGILLNTPGVSWRWVGDNFNIERRQLVIVNELTEQWHHLGIYNMLSATEQDGVIYMANARHKSEIPVWVTPFVLDDIKKGMRTIDITRKWNISKQSIGRIKRGVIGNVFHSSLQSRRGRNLGR